jgi:hypothetical protein
MNLLVVFLIFLILANVLMAVIQTKSQTFLQHAHDSV